jgi:hypothetical protein
MAALRITIGTGIALDVFSSGCLNKLKWNRRALISVARPGFGRGRA